MTDSSSAAHVVAGTPYAMVVADGAGRVAYWNPAAERLYGWRADEAFGRPLAELFGPLSDAAQKATPEHVRRRRDGSLIYVHSSVGAVEGFDGGTLYSEVDVTPLKVQQEARLIDTRYRGLLDSMPDAIVIVNGIGRIIFANGQAESMFGYDRDGLLGQPIERLMPERFRGVHLQHRDTYLQQSRTRPMGLGLELRGLRAGGEEFPVEISLSPLQTEVGRLGMSAIRDISERHRVERALQEKNDELERANRAKDSFLATMSHELRTPLNAIIGFTGILLMKLTGPLNADQERQLGLVQTSAKHLLSLINDLLDVAKIDSGNVQLAFEAVGCRAVVEDVAATLRPVAEAKGLQLRLALPADEAVVMTDRRALRQILLNLAGNAIKFTDSGHVALEMAVQPGEVVLAVVDTGLGITPEDQARLFRPFTQVGHPSARRSDGTGLGLYLSSKLAELLGGRLGLQSEPRAGSRFHLTLPAAEQGSLS
jgi:protein-histidine pros-kinase